MAGPHCKIFGVEGGGVPHLEFLFGKCINVGINSIVVQNSIKRYNSSKLNVYS